MTTTTTTTPKTTRRSTEDATRRLLREARLLTTAHRITLGVLLTFGALNAFGGGVYGLSGARDVPREWLAGTPFTDYTIPSAILFFVVGGSFAAAALAVLVRAAPAKVLALGAAVVVLGWIAVQVALIGYVSWMQPVTAVVGCVILALAALMPKRA